jgi:hypothetical protein
MNPTGANRRIDSTLRPTTFYLQGNDASLQLVPASTTDRANKLDRRCLLVANNTKVQKESRDYSRGTRH